MTQLQLKTLGILTVLAAVVGVRGSFEYDPKDPQDPENVSLVRQALAALGINPNGIKITSFYEKWWVLGYSYKVTYVDGNGVTCMLHFRWKKAFGLKVTDMPHCDGREIGVGDVSGDGGCCPETLGVRGDDHQVTESIDIES